VIGTDALPNHPFDPAAPAVSANVPIIVSTTLEDAALGLTNFDLTEQGLLDIIEKRSPVTARTSWRSTAVRPGRDAVPDQAQMLTDAGSRRAAFTMAARKAALGAAPAYMYQWNWRTPAYDGKFGAVHGIDVSASFHSYRDGFFAGSTQGKRMADRLASCWAAFAKTGDPNNAHVPPWKPYDDAGRAVMIFDNDTRLDMNPARRHPRLVGRQPATSGTARIGEDLQAPVGLECDGSSWDREDFHDRRDPTSRGHPQGRLGLP
jgi:para-nitrobenzyl esterase